MSRLPLGEPSTSPERLLPESRANRPSLCHSRKERRVDKVSVNLPETVGSGSMGGKCPDCRGGETSRTALPVAWFGLWTTSGGTRLLLRRDRRDKTDTHARDHDLSRIGPGELGCTDKKSDETDCSCPKVTTTGWPTRLRPGQTRTVRGGRAMKLRGRASKRQARASWQLLAGVASSASPKLPTSTRTWTGQICLLRCSGKFVVVPRPWWPRNAPHKAGAVLGDEGDGLQC